VYNGGMKIEFGLMSIVSLAYLIVFGISSTEISLDSIEISAVVSGSDFSVSIHPVLALWVPQTVAYNHGGLAFTYGNVMVFGDHVRDNARKEYVFNHERTHTQQFRALGLLIYPARFILNIEPDEGIMWIPPDLWPLQWSFITITSL